MKYFVFILVLFLESLSYLLLTICVFGIVIMLILYEEDSLFYFSKKILKRIEQKG